MVTKRRYDSSRRRQQAAETRGAIAQAAGRLFAERGWGGTGMRDVAEAAGVAVETIYSHFPSKAELLSAAVDAAVVGDTEQVPLAERPQFRALARGPLAVRAAAAAQLNAEISQRVAPLHRALEHAAESEAALAARLRADEERRRLTVRQAGELVAARALTEVEADGLWALTSVQVHQLLTGLRGWTEEAYAAWLASMLQLLLSKRRVSHRAPVGPDESESRTA